MADASVTDAFMGGTGLDWAKLGVNAIGALGGAARSASAPAPGGSSADALFGSVQVAPDFGQWNVVVGPGASGTQTSGPKYGPVQSPSQTMDKVSTQPIYQVPSYGAAAGVPTSGGYGSMPIPASGNQVNAVGGVPVMWILIAVAIWLATKKS